MALRLFNGPIGRPETELDVINAREAAIMLRKILPELEKIRTWHGSERLRRKAAQYLRFIATRVGRLLLRSFAGDPQVRAVALMGPPQCSQPSNRAEGEGRCPPIKSIRGAFLVDRV